MANVKKGTLTAPPQWWKHLKDWKRIFWKSERQAHEKEIRDRGEEVIKSRSIDRRAKVDKFGDTYWPDTDFPE